MAISRIHWRVGVFCTEPLWTVDPDISVMEAISRHHLFPHADSSAVEVTVKFLAEGSFNKVYTVDTKATSTSPIKSYIFRATLPVEPGDKVRNEVATLDYIKRRTTIPVPTVIAYDSSSENELGFEWILMEKIPGEPLRGIWPRLSDTSKTAFTREIASYVLQIRKNCVFHDIGGLYHDSDAGFTVGPIVTQSMFINGRRQLISRTRGPYHHDSDYVRALIELQIADVHFLKTMPSNDPNFDEDLIEDGPAILHAMEGMLSLLPKIFPRDDEKDEPFRTVLLHPDISLNNIMVDPNTHKVTGIIDWECTNASPYWQDTYPQFLTGPEVEEQPDPVEPGDTNPLRNELWDNWEKMQLRAVFDEVAGPLVEEPLAGLKREFINYVHLVEYTQVMVERWMEETREKIEA